MYSILKRKQLLNIYKKEIYQDTILGEKDSEQISTLVKEAEEK